MTFPRGFTPSVSSGWTANVGSAAAPSASANIDTTDVPYFAAQLNWGVGSNASGEVGSATTLAWADFAGGFDGVNWTLVFCSAIGGANPTSGIVVMIACGGLWPYPQARLRANVASGLLTVSASWFGRGQWGVWN